MKYNSSTCKLATCELFSVGLGNVVRIVNSKQVVYKEMTRDEAKSNLAKCNLIGGIQFTHVHNCLMIM